MLGSEVGSSSSDDEDGDEQSKLDINGGLLERWLEHGTGVVASAMRRAEPDTDATRIMSGLHGVDYTTAVRPSSIKLGKLAKRVYRDVAGLQSIVDSSTDDGDRTDIAIVRDLIYGEMRGFVAGLGVSFSDSGVVHCKKQDGVDGESPADRAARELEEAVEEAAEDPPDGVGTRSDPFECPTRGEAPINETTPGYMTLAFPVLFPFGLGSLSDHRDVALNIDQYFTHLHKYEDDRFKTHRRWPYFSMNTRERRIANEEASRFVSAPRDDFSHMTLGDLKELSKADKFKIMAKVSAFGRGLRNSPAFFGERRKELQSMCDALGDPHVFATHSFADTYCPYLSNFILKWRDEKDHLGNDLKSPFDLGLSDAEVKRRKWDLLEANPALAAHFFALKTELYLEHICIGILGATAYWSRYEWQSRGATHAHYFLWLPDVPSVAHLETWIREELELVREGRAAGDDEEDTDRDPNAKPSYTSEELDDIVDELNRRALADRATQEAARWWATKAQHNNEAWDAAEELPDMPRGAPHPAGLKFSDLGTMADLRHGDYAGKANLNPGDAPKWLTDDVALCRNKMTRHTDHVPYCLRRNIKSGVLFCRFHFPLRGHEPMDTPHFYVERNGGHFRWKVHLGMNDPLMNTVNLWQIAAHRANVDFRPLFDHHTAIEYSTKYATKAEKGSNAIEAVFAHAVSRASNNYDDDASAVHAYASFLVQTVGGRDWSSQEVGHVLFGHDTCIATHDFDYATLTDKRALVSHLDGKKNGQSVVNENKWDLYLRRLEFASRLKKGDKRQLQLEAFFDKEHKAEPTDVDDVEHIASCSFHEFYSQYRLLSAGAAKGMRSIVRRLVPTVVVIKPRMPRLWMKVGHAKRRDYCRHRLMLHKQFLDMAVFVDFMQSHNWDWEAAYEEFALGEDAPPTVRDDFHELEFEEEGEIVEQGNLPEVHGQYGMFEANRVAQEARLKLDEYDWEGDTRGNYSEAQVSDSAIWMTKLKENAPAVKPDVVDIASLNPAQKYVYRVVEEHQRASKSSSGPPSPINALICGTAGSGKTYLIKSLKQLLGGTCLVLAPTGVAADNIGGQTYQSVIPTPMKDVLRGNIDPSPRRLASFCKALDGIEYIIIDEMSMVGRRSLGHIDYLLREASGK